MGSKNPNKKRRRAGRNVSSDANVVVAANIGGGRSQTSVSSKQRVVLKTRKAGPGEALDRDDLEEERAEAVIDRSTTSVVNAEKMVRDSEEGRRERRDKDG